MKEKEYPMPDDHKKLMADLLDLIAMRDKSAAEPQIRRARTSRRIAKRDCQSRQIDRTRRSVIGA